MKRIAVLVSLLITAAFAVAQEADVRALLDRAAAESQDDPAAAVRDASQALEISRAHGLAALTAEALILRGQALHAAGDLAGAVANLAEALALTESGSGPGLAPLRPEALHAYGKALAGAGRDGEAAPVLRRAVEAAGAAGDPNLVTAATISMAWSSFRLGRYDDALEQALAALREVEASGDRFQEANVSLLLGFVRRNMQQRDEALAYFEQTERIARQVGDPILALRALNEQGNVLQAGRRLAEAVERQVTALKEARQVADPVTIASCANDLGGAYFLMERYGDALAHFQEAYAINARLGNNREMGLGATNIANLHATAGNLDEAKAWAEDGLRAVLRTQRPPDEEIVRTTLALILSERGEHAAAFEQLSLAYDLRQKIASDEGARRVADLTAFYEADKRQAEIEILTRDSAIQQLELDREKGRRNLFLGGLAASGALAALLALGYRSKLRANRAITRANAELTEARDELDRLSRTDTLTGLANRRHVEERLTEEVLRYQRSSTEFAVVIADLDDFKRINDEHGHPTGDAVLAHVAAVLRDSVRTLDTVGRWGGEEFILLLPMTSLDGACALAEKVRQAVAGGSVVVGDATLAVTATFGVAAHLGGDPAATLQRADEALYRGKQAGKNRVERG